MNEFMMFLREFLGVVLFLDVFALGGLISAIIWYANEIRKDKKNKRYYKR